MTSPASKERPCSLLRSLDPIPTLLPVAVWPRVNYSTSGLICKVGEGSTPSGEEQQGRSRRRGSCKSKKQQVGWRPGG